MRDDMAKVVTERPRYGHRKKSRKTTGARIRRYDPGLDYDEPTRLPVAPGRQYSWEAKEFSDLINPLRRFLRSCVGRPWRTVHSELARTLDRRSVAGLHIWDHVWREIAPDCRMGSDGLAYSNRRGRLSYGNRPVQGLFVHPASGLVRNQTEAVIRKRRRAS